MSHEPHLRSAGRWSTPATNTLEQLGQEIFSSRHLRRVASWLTRTRALQRLHSISPKPVGSMPPHFGQDRGGGATLDSTLNSSAMESLLFGVENQLLGNEIPRHVKGQAKFFRETGDELLRADLIPGALKVQHDDFAPLLVDGQGSEGGS